MSGGSSPANIWYGRHPPGRKRQDFLTVLAITTAQKNPISHEKSEKVALLIQKLSF
jgi:hypothetical protein